MKADQVRVDAVVMKFDFGDGESVVSYKICWYDFGKGIFSCYSILADILFCASAVGENVVYPTF